MAAFKPFHSPTNDGDADPDASILAAAAGAHAAGRTRGPYPLSQDAEPDVARAMRAYGEATRRRRRCHRRGSERLRWRIR